jgi:hypothetical protein
VDEAGLDRALAEGDLERVDHELPGEPLVDQPTTRREKRSITTARYSQPSRVGT